MCKLAVLGYLHKPGVKDRKQCGEDLGSPVIDAGFLLGVVVARYVSYDGRPLACAMTHQVPSGK